MNLLFPARSRSSGSPVMILSVSGTGRLQEKAMNIKSNEVKAEVLLIKVLDNCGKSQQTLSLKY
jgi:hypothetical protein